MKAINRIIDQSETSSTKNTNPTDYITVKDDYKQIKLKHNDIQYIQAYGNYLKIFTKEKMFMVSDTMKNCENTLPSDIFIRIHKSYLINKTKIEKIILNKIIIDLKELPIGNSYKRMIKELL